VEDSTTELFRTLKLEEGATRNFKSGGERGCWQRTTASLSPEKGGEGKLELLKKKKVRGWGKEGTGGRLNINISANKKTTPCPLKKKKRGENGTQ